MWWIYAAIAAASLAAGFFGGVKVEDNARDSQELKRTQAESRDRLVKRERGDQAATGHEVFKAKEEVRYVTQTRYVDRIVEKPVYRNACFDDGGLQLLNDAIAGREPASELAPVVPEPAAAAR